MREIGPLTTLATTLLCIVVSTDGYTRPHNDISLYTDMTIETELKERERTDYGANAHFTFIPSYQLSQRTTLSFRFTATQDLARDRQTAFSTSYLGFSHLLAQGGTDDFISLSVAGRALLPLDKHFREQTSYRGGLSLRSSLVFDLSKIGIPSLKYTLRLSYTENLHRYKTFNNVVNDQRSLALTSLLEIYMMDNLAWITLFGPTESWNYRGTRSEIYTIDSSLKWNFPQNGESRKSLSMGYSIQAPTTTATGKNNIKLYDNENSKAYLTLAYVF